MTNIEQGQAARAAEGRRRGGLHGSLHGGFDGGFGSGFDGGIAELRGKAARMAPHWAAPGRTSGSTPVPVSRLHGVTVDPASARLLDAMSDYGD
ncbi:hypothetical protein ACFY93_26780 [Streptomyces sp. NPDC008313]|uniref:hypothetical protein n=1 Tax=Streptomyces sp. NPDC008313 TaxID=3364826 RepID=UPI0036E15451